MATGTDPAEGRQAREVSSRRGKGGRSPCARRRCCTRSVDVSALLRFMQSVRGQDLMGETEEGGRRRREEDGASSTQSN